MPNYTSTLAFPIPLGADLAFARTPQDLALAVDATLPSYDSGFGTGRKPEAFLIRSTADGGIGSASTTYAATDWMSTNVSTDTFSVTVGSGLGRTWWMVGSYMQIATSGTATAGFLVASTIQSSYTDPITGQVTFDTVVDSTGESNTAGEHICTVGIFSGVGLKFTPFINWDGSGGTKFIAAGAVLWGFEMGPY
jgi:hypothetical protein